MTDHRRSQSKGNKQLGAKRAVLEPEVTLGIKTSVKGENELQGWDVVIRKESGY